MLAHCALEQVGRSERILPGDRVIMPAVADDGACESLCEFRAGPRYFANRFSTAGIVVASMNAVLVDGGSRAEHAQGVKEIYSVALFS